MRSEQPTETKVYGDGPSHVAEVEAIFGSPVGHYRAPHGQGFTCEVGGRRASFFLTTDSRTTPANVAANLTRMRAQMLASQEAA